MDDEQIIRNKLSELSVIFKNPTLDLFERLFTPDCDYITFNGQHLKGIKENYDVHKKLVGLWVFKDAELQFTIKQIKFIDQHIAIAILTGGIKFRWQKTMPKNRLSINTNVFVKQDDDWKLASFHNCRIKPPGLLQRLFSK